MYFRIVSSRGTFGFSFQICFNLICVDGLRIEKFTLANYNIEVGILFMSKRQCNEMAL